MKAFSTSWGGFFVSGLDAIFNLNARGDKRLAGTFDLEVLRTDSIYKQWFKSNTQLFSLKGKTTHWKKNLENTEVDIYLGTWCGDSKKWVP